MISLITMAQGNPVALKRTFDSFKEFVDEIIFGDITIFEEDSKLIESYKSEYNLKIIKYPFNFIFKNGFSEILNQLAAHSKNDLVIYMNCSEIIDGDHSIFNKISEEYNCYYFDHATDPHRWYRFYNKQELKWDGIIHEEIVGEHRPYPKPIFRMADTEKDMNDPFRAKVFNDIKELCYFNQYVRLIDEPEHKKTTNSGWLNFALDGYESFKYRMNKKGKRYEAFLTNNLEMYLEDIKNNPELL